MQKIIENLWICSHDELSSYNGIATFDKIVNVAYELSESPFHNIFFPLYDGEQISEKKNRRNEKTFLRAIRYITRCLNRNEKVLVHCQAGVSRSASVVLGVLIERKEFGEYYDENYNEFKKIYGKAFPAPFFVSILMKKSFFL